MCLKIYKLYFDNLLWKGRNILARNLGNLFCIVRKKFLFQTQPSAATSNFPQPQNHPHQPLGWRGGGGGEGVSSSQNVN